MKYGSVCSGIEAATVAWHPLGWKPAFFSQYDPEHNYKGGPDFPSAVLAHHYPNVPNLGDMTRFDEWPDAAIDVLVGGTPCQDYSIAGLRAGLDGERGNLMLVYAAIARRYRPKFLVWENVPGVLSSGEGRDFGSLLGLLSGKRVTAPASGWRSSGVVPGIKGAYGLAWRILDAQYVRVDGFGRAVPQRRRRVFVVGYLGDWRRAAAVLFERQSMQGDSPPRRQAGQNPSPTLSARTKGGGGLGTDFDLDGGLIANPIAQTLTRDAESAGRGGYAGRRQEDDINLVAHTLNAKGGVGRLDYESETLVAHSLRGGGFDASEDGTGRGTPLVPVALPYTLAIRGRGDTHDLEFRQDGVANALLTPNGGRAGIGVGAICAPTIGFSVKDHGADAMNDLSPTIRAGGFDKSHANAGVMPGVFANWRVRRLMPVECERLQGFPDGYTDVPWRKKNWTPDGPRYKGLGNSMAVNCMRWLGSRIQQVDKLCSDC